MYQFRDPIHGFIEVTDAEKRIIDSFPFQRLRNIRQLATTYLVYHGAEHTRFGHSLGVMHLVTRVFDLVTQKHPDLFRDDPAENAVVTRWYRQILRLIALVHDLGHAPFSHASEDLFQDGREHEDYTKDIILTTEIADIIREIGDEFQREYGAEYMISTELLWMIYGEEASLKEGYILPDFLFLKSFLDSEMDCDKMDYLLRDSEFCGVSYGLYDLDRFISTLTVYKNKSEKVLQLAIETGGIQAFEEFVLARYFMFIQVYFHKTRRYFDKRLGQCLQEILPEGRYPTDIDEYLKWDDVRVLQCMKDSGSDNTCQYLSRQTMTCIFETSAHSNRAEADNSRMIANIMEDRLGMDAILKDSIDKAALKLLPVYLSKDDDSGKDIKIMDRYGVYRNVMEESLILKSILAPISIKRLYVRKERQDEAEEIIQGICR